MGKKKENVVVTVLHDESFLCVLTPCDEILLGLKNNIKVKVQEVFILPKSC